MKRIEYTPIYKGVWDSTPYKEEVITEDYEEETGWSLPKSLPVSPIETILVASAALYLAAQLMRAIM